jgi:hypothetical protein
MENGWLKDKEKVKTTMLKLQTNDGHTFLHVALLPKEQG